MDEIKTLKLARKRLLEVYHSAGMKEIINNDILNYLGTSIININLALGKIKEVEN